jgi:predicted dehydrogenase
MPEKKVRDVIGDEIGELIGLRHWDDQYHQPIGEDANVFRLQIADLVNAATTGATPRGATAEDGLASVRAMVALAQSVTTGDRVRLDDVTGGLA